MKKISDSQIWKYKKWHIKYEILFLLEFIEIKKLSHQIQIDFDKWKVFERLKEKYLQSFKSVVESK